MIAAAVHLEGNPAFVRMTQFLFLPLHDFHAIDPCGDVRRVAFDAGAKRTLVPMASVGDIASVPGELFAKFQTSFYADAVDAAFKGLGVQ